MNLKQKDKVFEKNVNGEIVSGNTYKEFIVNYLTKLVNQTVSKKLDVKQRISAYVDYFVDNFNYDTSLRDEILGENKKYAFNTNTNRSKDTFEINEKKMFDLLYKGIGVCREFSAMLSLLSLIDFELTKEMSFVQYATGPILIKEKNLTAGHAVNIVHTVNKCYVIDLSSIIHSRDGEFKQNKNNFKLIPLCEYTQNMEKEGVEFVCYEEENEPYLTELSIPINVDNYYELLNAPVDKLVKNHQDLLHPVYLMSVVDQFSTN